MSLYEQWIQGLKHEFSHECGVIEMYNTHLNEYECGGLKFDTRLAWNAKAAIYAIGDCNDAAEMFFHMYFCDRESNIAWHLNDDGVLPDNWEEIA